MLLQKDVLDTVIDDEATASYCHNIHFPRESGWSKCQRLVGRVSWLLTVFSQ